MEWKRRLSAQVDERMEEEEVETTGVENEFRGLVKGSREPD